MTTIEEGWNERNRKIAAEDERSYRNEKLLIMASVIASGVVRGGQTPSYVATQSLEIALHLYNAVKEMP